MSDTPSPNGSNGRQSNGRFAAGNPGGPGNPHGRRTAELRSMLLETVSDDDFRAVVVRLVELAKGGDLGAIKEVFDRLIGRSQPIHEREAPTDLIPTDKEALVASLRARITEINTARMAGER